MSGPSRPQRACTHIRVALGAVRTQRARTLVQPITGFRGPRFAGECPANSRVLIRSVIKALNNCDNLTPIKVIPGLGDGRRD